MAGEPAGDGSISILRDSRYTGENRCLPCTVLNLVIAATGAVGVGAVLAGQWPLGLFAAAGTFTGATWVIYRKGYLIPGTPTVTRRYLPDRVLRWFGKDSSVATGGAIGSTEEADVDPDQLFRRIGIVTSAPDGQDLVLDATFESAWLDAVEEVAGTTEALREQVADFLGIDPAALDVERQRGSFEMYHDDARVVQWESKAACQADVAAAAIMPLFDSDWSQRPFHVRSELLGALRLFLETCPTCGGHVSLSHEVVTSCCSSRDVVAAVCTGCNARVFEVAIDPDQFEPADAEESVAG